MLLPEGIASSRFGSKNQFNNLGALGLAWLLIKENFVRDNLAFLSFGKLRGSYGVTGNDQIGDYRCLNLYNPVSANIPYQSAISLTSIELPNPYLE